MSDATAGREIIRRRHPEWGEFQVRWRWLLDSLEGGDRYRQAIYGYDWNGLPVRNLVRHKREVPAPRERPALLGSAVYPAGLASGAGDPTSGGMGQAVDPAQFANDSDYEMRRARTPVPTLVREAIECHLSSIFSKEVSRKGPRPLEAWWADVDGQGTTMADWVEQVVAPLYLLLGQIDVLMDHPPAPEGIKIRSRTDQQAAGLDRAVASYILPENLLDWRLKPNGQYAWALVREQPEDPRDEEVEAASEVARQQDRELRAANPRYSGQTEAVVYRYRAWDAEKSVLYDNQGREVRTVKHAFGRVPIVRVFDRRKHRCRNSGQSRYEGIAERMREFYNRDSELILSDTLQAHPLMQGPEDYVEGDDTIPIGPNYLLPMKKNGSAAGATYQGFEVIDFPKDGADSIRTNKNDLRDEIDRDARLTKPAGAQTHGKGTVAQSGISKALDNDQGHKLLSQLAASLARFEAAVCELALAVLGDGLPDPADVQKIAIVYPAAFDLESADELTEGLVEFQGTLSAAGECPEVEVPWLQQIVRERLKGRDQAFYEGADQGIEQAVQTKATRKSELAEAGGAMRPAEVADAAAPGNADADAENAAMAAPGYSPMPSNYGGY